MLACLPSGAALLDANPRQPYAEMSPSAMTVALQNQSLATRPCVYCGKQMLATLNRCPHCREEMPQVQLSHRVRTGGRQQIRRGLLYMLLAGVIQYFAS